jgi:hypothetical protein
MISAGQNPVKRRKHVRLRLISLFAVIAVAVPAVALASHTSTLKFEAYLLGKSEIPKAAPSGKATAKITITGTKVCWKFLSVKGIGKPVVAHIHKGGAKVANGAVVVPLGGKYAATGCIASTAAIVNAIHKNPKGYYVNVHTAKYPNGAIRGQLHAGD